MTPDVSVLLPYRDTASTIAEAIEGVLAERGVALELVAIDDGSTDGGHEIVDAIARRDPRVRHERGEARGIVAALQRASSLARAPFFARMDADDVSRPGRIARALELLRRDASIAVVATRVEPFPDEAIGDGLRRYVAWQNGLITPEDHARAIFVESPVCHPSVTMRRDAFERVGGYRDVDGPEDYDLWLRLDAAGAGIAKLPETLLRWRHRQGRATFADARYDLARFPEAKAPFLARRLAALGKPIAIWGAGKTGKRLARALEPHGLRARRFYDIDPRKIGRPARGAPTLSPHAPDGARAIAARGETIVVAVGAVGARDLVRAHLDALGLVEGREYLCGS